MVTPTLSGDSLYIFIAYLYGSILYGGNLPVMRNIPFSSGLIFLMVYLMLSAAAWYALRTTFANKSLPVKPAPLFVIFSIVQALSFFILFIFPYNTATNERYSLYFFYNSILITDLFTRLPLALAGLVSLVLSRSVRLKTTISHCGTIISAAVLLIFIWGFTFGSRSLKKQELVLAFPDLPEAFDGIRIAHISDTHLGNFHYPEMFDRAVTANNEFDPDILVFTGDLVNNFATETQGWADIFNKFRAGYKFAVPGNHDYGDYYRWPDREQKDENRRRIMQAFSDFGFNLLLNRSVPVVIGQDTIYVAGVENWGHPPFPQYADLQKSTGEIPPGSFTILLSHDPSHWYSVIRHLDGFPLTLSGHSHGLQWGIKLAGIEFSLIWLSRKTWAGLYAYNGNYLYVNRGLGTIGIPLRVDMPAEITFITLKRGEID